MSNPQEAIFRYSDLVSHDHRNEGGESLCTNGLETVISRSDQGIHDNKHLSDATVTTSDLTTTGLMTGKNVQSSAVEIKGRFFDVQAEERNHSCQLHTDTTSRKSSSILGTERKISLKDCLAHERDSSRKTSASLGEEKKISLIDSSVGSVMCRICLEGDAVDDPLINPCLCTGSASHVHITCLKKWLMTSGSSVCELCLYEMDVGWKATSMWKALKNLSHARMTNRKICWALLVSIAALTLPLFCICIFVLDDENLRLQLSQPASMALSYGVILISCTAYLALLFMVAYLTWKWNFCPNTARCHFPTEIEIRVESLEERMKRGRTRRGGYYRNATPILTSIGGNEYGFDERSGRNHDLMDSYWMTAGGYV